MPTWVHIKGHFVSTGFLQKLNSVVGLKLELPLIRVGHVNSIIFNGSKIPYIEMVEMKKSY